MNINFKDPEFPELQWKEEIKEEINQLVFREWKQQDAIKNLENNAFYKEFEEDNLNTENDIKNFKEHYGFQ